MTLLPLRESVASVRIVDGLACWMSAAVTDSGCCQVVFPVAALTASTCSASPFLSSVSPRLPEDGAEVS